MTTPGELYGRPWSEPEYIITLHHYLIHRNESSHSGSEHAKQVSEIIGRTPASVSMRMENYASIDPELQKERSGLTHINAFGRRLFRHWCSRQDALRECAEAFTRDIQSRHVPTLFNPQPIRIPKAFDRYELVDQIGEGGSGTVFSCIAVETQELYAIKIIKADLIHDPEALHRFRREIRALKEIDHCSIVRLHEDNLDSERNFPAFVMDHAAYSLTSFADHLCREMEVRKRPAVERDDAKKIMSSMFDALSRMHGHHPKLIHRDINPNNVLRLKSDEWVLADFGLAKFIRTAPMSTSFQTTTQRGWGTMWYTAPEQYRNFSEADERTDIYSLGMLIWELFTSSDPPPHPAHLGLPSALGEVHLKATERDPTNRFETVAQLKQAFDAAVDRD